MKNYMEKMIPMKKIAYAALLLISSVGTASTVQAFQCNVCHSKNPAMVRMHKAVQAKDIGCFDCHKIGEKLMGKSQPKDRDSLLARRATDPLCVGCHTKEGESR
jgi:hypothetical protein